MGCFHVPHTTTPRLDNGDFCPKLVLGVKRPLVWLLAPESREWWFSGFVVCRRPYRTRCTRGQNQSHTQWNHTDTHTRLYNVGKSLLVLRFLHSIMFASLRAHTHTHSVVTGIKGKVWLGLPSHCVGGLLFSPPVQWRLGNGVNSGLFAACHCQFPNGKYASRWWYGALCSAVRYRRVRLLSVGHDGAKGFSTGLPKCVVLPSPTIHTYTRTHRALH